MQDRMFNAADILIDIHPVIGLIFTERFLIVLRIRIAQEIPRRVNKRIHRIGFATSFFATLRTRRKQKFFIRFQRRYCRLTIEIYIGRQAYRQIFLGYGHHAAMRAVNDRNRHAPIPLTGDQPITQPVVDMGFADSLFLHFFRNLATSFRTG